MYVVMNLPEFEKIPDAIAIDLDGTLLNGQTQLSYRNRQAIEKCTGYGIPIIIATSRPARSINRFLGNRITSICSIVMMNGAIAVGNPPLSGYHREIIPEETAREIISLALSIESEIAITIELDGYKFGANWTASPESLWLRNSATAEMVVSVEEALVLQPSKIALGGIGTRMLDMAQELKRWFRNSISVVHSFTETPLLMVTTVQATKPAALKKLLSLRSISMDDVVAIGDDIPDIEMLLECGIPVAMANSLPKVKAICRYETASNDNDGVAVVLEKMLEAVR